MGNLSDRVMNMKFMRKTDVDNESVNKDDQQKKIKDTSEWVLPNSSNIRARNQLPNVVQSIGYASINSFTEMDEIDEKLEEHPVPANIGRRRWGEPEQKKSSESEIDITRLKDSIPKKNVCILGKFSEMVTTY